MADLESIEARVGALETELAVAYRLIWQERCTARAVQTMLCALIDSFRPGEPERASEWFDAMEFVATQNAGLIADLASDEIIREHGLDSEMLAAMEDEKAEVAKLLRNLYAMLKNPQGGLARD
ncbi:MAG: hypothetical protein M9939_26410 [Mesorhizobium sp.]|nr:hypothetical protein [Mesorhizobium sp.]MCO5085120.1 hypothetical protein [Rhizobiaceae bacterium]MCO5164626.1 hypothetical protein [Mesorhizobium sp.]